MILQVSLKALLRILSGQVPETPEVLDMIAKKLFKTDCKLELT